MVFLEDLPVGRSRFTQDHGGQDRGLFTSGDLPDPVSAREAELVKAVADETSTTQHALPGGAAPVKRQPRAVLERYASRIIKLAAEGKGSFVEQLGRKLRDAGVELPSVTIEYNGLSVEADALLGAAGMPTLANVLLGHLKKLVGLGGLKTAPLTVLKGVTGKIKPGRLTLLLGPPGAGKTVFLEVLAGRLKPHPGLRITGDVKYNGHKSNEFVIERTIGIVDQYDDHLPSYTVHETLTFAHLCQTGLSTSPQFNPMMELRKASQHASAAKGVNSGSKEGLHADEKQPSSPLIGADAESEDGSGKAVQAAGTDRARRPTAEELGWGSRRSMSLNSLIPSVPEEGAAPKTGVTKAEQPKKQAAPAGAEDTPEFDKLADEVWGSGVKTEVMIRLLGLQGCADTVVGGPMLRGVSGGEKRRVTTAEVLVGPKVVLLMDEISTGLDSATTYTVISLQKAATHALSLTTIISLLQPQPEVYELFDDVLLLTDGHVCFHGPVGQAVPFFATLGLVCPLRKDAASFLQEVTTSKGQREFATQQLLAERGSTAEDLLMVPIEEISRAFYEQTQWGTQMVQELQTQPFPKTQSHPAALVKTRYALTAWEAIQLVTRRQMKLTLRDAALVRGRLVQVVVIGLIIGSLFSGLGDGIDAARSYFGISFLSIMFLAMGSMPVLAITMMTRSVFYKQRDNNFFPPYAYGIAMFLCQLPLALLETFIFSIIVYFLVDYYRAAAQFFTFVLICFCSILVLSALFRMLACLAPNMVTANAFGGLLLAMLVVTSGFAIVRLSIPGWWIWAYYISPFAYGLRSVVINEMRSPKWEGPTSPSNPTSIGITALKTFDFFTEKYWIWVGVAFMLGATLLLTYIAILALTYLNPERAKPSIPDAADKEIKEVAKNLQRRLSRASRDAEVTPEQVAVDVKAVEAAAKAAGQAGSSLPFQPITLVVKDLRYFVDAPKGIDAKLVAGASSGHPGMLELLKGITAYSEPGVLTALMGGSGAGKTTLMDVIAGRKTQGIIEGEVLVNGYPKEQRTWARVCGYVEQTDIHSPMATVREALAFSARMRLPASAAPEQVAVYLEEVLDMVELRAIQHTLVGVPGQSGLSVEQRKRLTIAVELVANPSVIFMDEPTSGLDARAAAIVMRTVKNVSRNRRTVMVTIHQPSTDIFEAFDALVLLQRGGRLTYFGPLGTESAHLISYLEAVPGVAAFQAGQNPATWMLEVTGGSMGVKAEAAPVDFPEVYKASGLYKDTAARAEMLAAEGKKAHSRLELDTRYSVSRPAQLRALMARNTRTYWRSPAYNLTRMIMTTLIALFYGTMYLNKGQVPATGGSAKNVQNVMGVIYGSTTFQGMFNLITVLPVVSYERTVYYRERAAGMYSSLSYTAATAAVEIPYLLSQIAIFVPIAYWLIGFDPSAKKFFFYCLLSFESLTMFTFFGQFLVFVTPNQQVAQILGAGLNTLWNIMNGFMLPYPSMPRGWAWFNRITPTTWIIYGLAVSQLGDQNQAVAGPNGAETTAAKYMEDVFGYHYDFRWYCVLIICAFIVFFRVSSVVAVKMLNFQRR